MSPLAIFLPKLLVGCNRGVWFNTLCTLVLRSAGKSDDAPSWCCNSLAGAADIRERMRPSVCWFCPVSMVKLLRISPGCCRIILNNDSAFGKAVVWMPDAGGAFDMKLVSTLCRARICSNICCADVFCSNNGTGKIFWGSVEEASCKLPVDGRSDGMAWIICVAGVRPWPWYTFSRSNEYAFVWFSFDAKRLICTISSGRPRIKLSW